MDRFTVQLVSSLHEDCIGVMCSELDEMESRIKIFAGVTGLKSSRQFARAFSPLLLQFLEQVGNSAQHDVGRRALEGKDKAIISQECNTRRRHMWLFALSGNLWKYDFLPAGSEIGRMAQLN